MIRHAWKASNEVTCFFHRVKDACCFVNCKFVDDFIALDQILIRTILLDVLLIVLIITFDHCDLDQDEEKFQREILSDEPNLIKLYLQVPHEYLFYFGFFMFDEF